MRPSKIPFGERDGHFYRAHEVDNGLACQCRCPGCQQPLNAANAGQKVVPHFRHAQASRCTAGVREGIRRAAVALIAQHKRLVLPRFYREVRQMASDGRWFSRPVSFNSITVTADTVEGFIEVEGQAFHAAFSVAEHRLLIWLRLDEQQLTTRHVPHAVTSASALEIDLSALSLEDVNDAAVFEQAVLTATHNKTWVHSHKADVLAQQAHTQLAVEIDAYETRLQAERAQRRAAAAEEEARQRARKVAYAAAREASAQRERARCAAEHALRVDAEAHELQARAALLIAASLYAATHWAGAAAECSACFLLSPPGTARCPYCIDKASSLQAITVPKDFANTATQRMRTSAKPARSLRVATALLTQPVYAPAPLC